jgi:hypothetical protein
MRKLISFSLGAVLLLGVLTLGSQSGLAIAGERKSNKEWQRNHHKRHHRHHKHHRYDHGGRVRTAKLLSKESW